MKIFVGTLILAAAAISAYAQEPKVVTPPAPPLPAAKVLAELAASSRGAVKNAPFSAEAVSESVQTLADGNRIVQNSTTKLYRNSEGRTRREMVNGSGGSLGTGFSFSYAPGVTILDPVGGSRYLLDEKLKTAEQMVLRTATVLPQIKAQAALTDEQRAAIEKLRAESGSGTPVTDEQRVAIEKLTGEMKAMAPTAVVTADGVRTLGGVATGVGGGVSVFAPQARTRYETKTEQLGSQNIEGVDCEGTRTTTIIPAGAIGNERPIETVYEKWYSKELQLVVMSKHTDPRIGEQTYRLTNIVRSEPDPSLFSLPTGYRVIGEPRGTTFRVSAKAEAEKTATAAKAAQPAATYVKNKP
ncbi:MAG: hypothetical protein ABJB40_08745 [Acidobacteriota bacterium]